jgi:hypothetical protein
MEVDACYTNADSSPKTLLSDRNNQEQKYTMALGGCRKTNKNATTNQKHRGLMGKR